MFITVNLYQDSCAFGNTLRRTDQAWGTRCCVSAAAASCSPRHRHCHQMHASAVLDLTMTSV